MDPMHDVLRSRWAEVDRIFGEALDRPAHDRGPFVRDACGGDVALLDTLSRLLESSDRAAESLDGPGTHVLGAAFGEPQPGATLDPAPAPDTRLGSYRLVRELGSGGMATVWEAERADGAFEGRVAIKILRGIGSPDIGRRLVIERQILSSLTHPRIARLLDGGTSEDGRPFLVMELVEGEPITRWADGNRLDVAQRIDLFLQVVDAVQYAHRHLVVHRDIKPSNVLVDREGRVRLLDFGIAKLLAEEAPAAETRPATRWMTPEYAAPEQILGQAVTTATDIHGLGVLLFELLTGHRPFGSGGRRGFALERAICEEVPDEPSSLVRRTTDGGSQSADLAQARATSTDKLARLLAGDLDAIVSRCLRKSPDERYRSAQELHDDVRRYVTGFPVRAREGHRAYRVRKFLGRHRVAATATAMVALLLAGSSLALARLQAETVVQRDLAASAAERAETEAENARLVIDFLADVFRGRDPDEAPPDTVTARELLAWGVERVGTEFTDRPAVQAELLLVLGNASANLGLLEDGIALKRQAVDLRRRTFGDRSPEAAAALVSLGGLYRSSRDFEAAEALYREAAAIERERGVDVADLDLGLALTLTGLRRYDSAIVLFRDIVADERERSGREATPGTRLALAFALRNAGELAEARALYEEVIPEYRALPTHEDRELAVHLNNLAYLERVEGDLDAAIASYREALEILSRVLGRGHPNSTAVADNLAAAYEFAGRDAETLAVLLETLEATEAFYPEGHWRVEAARGHVGDHHMRVGDLEEAEPLLTRQATYYQQEFGTWNDWTSFAWARVAVIQLIHGDSAWSRPFMDRLHSYLAGQDLSRALVNLLEGFLHTLRVTGPEPEYARFRALLPDTTSATPRGGA